MILLIYVAIMALRLSRVERSLRELMSAPATIKRGETSRLQH